VTNSIAVHALYCDALSPLAQFAGRRNNMAPLDKLRRGRYPTELTTLIGSGAMIHRAPNDNSPILLVPYVWIGDFVRCHSVVQVVNARWPGRPVDVLTSTLCAPLLDYMPGVRKGIVCDFPRRRLALALNRQLARRLKDERYGTALVMSRKWKAALAPFLAGIPERVGFVGEMRFGLLNDLRRGEQALERMVDRCAVLALPKDAPRPAEWPLPRLVVPAEEIAAWRARRGMTIGGRPKVALAPGAVGPGKRWPLPRFAELAKRLAADNEVWVVGGPNETPLAATIAAAAPGAVRDLTGHDLREAILALAAADAAVSNDSGLLHVAAAIATPVVGLFGSTSPWHWAPLNPIAATLEAPWQAPCEVCGKADCKIIEHRRIEDIAVETVLAATQGALAKTAMPSGRPDPIRYQDGR
jgi:heptosyltransferase-2